MNVLFEEDGVFRSGSVMTDNDSTLQVETPHGKRVKLKAANVLLRYTQPAASELIARAETEAAGMEIDFLWEMCGDDEFGFVEFAEDYFGHKPSAVESTALLLRMHAAPVYFHRKGRGRFRKAPPDILKAALAGQEKKRLQAEAVERMSAELVAGTLPEGFAGMLPQLLYKPDRNRLETKALESACASTGTNPARLLLKVGAFASAYDYHYGRFLFEYFPQGTDFPSLPVPASLGDDLPLADVQAFSIDDATTTEIDDAFSLTPREGGGWIVGVHIAAPGLGIAPGDAIDAVARNRLSTVYMPGNKITMLPDAVVDAFTLGAGSARPALSLYIEVAADYRVLGHRSVIERVPVAANLRHNDLEPLFNEATIGGDGPDFTWRRELTVLWELATVLEAGRGKPAANTNLLDYNYYVDWERSNAEGPGHITIERRKRGSPLDKLVAELMIHANSTWGKQLAQAGIPAIYRAQTGGRVRMTTAAAPHEGLGVDCYAWSSSPLRRYVDLCNQWQLIAHLRGTPPHFPPRSAELGAAMNDFDATYSAYNEFQRGMERYWCLRWLRQEGRKEFSARVLRENIVRLEDLPLVFKAHALPATNPGMRVQLGEEGIDYLDLDLRVRHIANLPPLGSEGSDVAEELEEDIDALLPPEQVAERPAAEGDLPGDAADKATGAGETSGAESGAPAA